MEARRHIAVDSARTNTALFIHQSNIVKSDGELVVYGFAAKIPREAQLASALRVDGNDRPADASTHSLISGAQRAAHHNVT